jgi:hypothetical protein
MRSTRKYPSGSWSQATRNSATPASSSSGNSSRTSGSHVGEADVEAEIPDLKVIALLSGIDVDRVGFVAPNRSPPPAGRT